MTRLYSPIVIAARVAALVAAASEPDPKEWTEVQPAPAKRAKRRRKGKRRGAPQAP